MLKLQYVRWRRPSWPPLRSILCQSHFSDVMQSIILRRNTLPPRITADAQFSFPARDCNSFFEARLRTLKSSNFSRNRDKKLTFGSKLAPGIFHRLSQAMRRMMSRRGFTIVAYMYLDDFLIYASQRTGADWRLASQQGTVIHFLKLVCEL
jgi:hypothetical protein